MIFLLLLLLFFLFFFFGRGTGRFIFGDLFGPTGIIGSVASSRLFSLFFLFSNPCPCVMHVGGSDGHDPQRAKWVLQTVPSSCLCSHRSCPPPPPHALGGCSREIHAPSLACARTGATKKKKPFFFSHRFRLVCVWVSWTWERIVCCVPP